MCQAAAKFARILPRPLRTRTRASSATRRGPPVAAIVAYDPSPIAPSRRDKKRFPFIANARLLCKEKLRDAFNEGFAKDQHCNVIHSSDNGREAMDYLRIIMPDGIDGLLSGVSSKPVARAA